MSLSPDVIDAMVASGLTVDQLAAIVKADLVAEERRRSAEAEAQAIADAEAAAAKIERRARDAAKKRRQRAAKGDDVPACPPMSPDVPGDNSGQVGTSRGHAGTPPETKVSPTPPSKTQTPTPLSPLKGTVPPTPNGQAADGVGGGFALTPGPTPNPPAKPKASDPPTTAELAQFEAWWRAWPNRVAKQAAVKAFVHVLRNDLASVETLIPATEAYTASLGVTGNHAAHPATWLNGRRWEDEHPQPTSLAPTLRTPNGQPNADAPRNSRLNNMLAGLVEFADEQQRGEGLVSEDR